MLLAAHRNHDHKRDSLCRRLLAAKGSGNGELPVVLDGRAPEQVDGEAEDEDADD